MIVQRYVCITNVEYAEKNSLATDATTTTVISLFVWLFGCLFVDWLVGLLVGYSIYRFVIFSNTDGLVDFILLSICRAIFR